MIRGYTSVIADLFHIGHLMHLRRCKTLCDYLIVGVQTDVSATLPPRHKPLPIIPYKERLEIIRALDCVDEVVRQESYYDFSLQKSLNVNIFFETTDHPESQIVEACKHIPTMVLPYYPNQSSTKIKDKILDEWRKA